MSRPFLLLAQIPSGSIQLLPPWLSSLVDRVSSKLLLHLPAYLSEGLSGDSLVGRKVNAW
jgi:hypothetical protein